MRVYKGVVQKGKRRGSQLGYPTINISLGGSELSGIYAGRVVIKDESPYMAALFADPSRNVLEAHILDFSDDLYGLEVTVEVHEKIHDSQQYETDKELKEAIGKDVKTVREYFDV